MAGKFLGIPCQISREVSQLLRKIFEAQADCPEVCYLYLGVYVEHLDLNRYFRLCVRHLRQLLEQPHFRGHGFEDSGSGPQSLTNEFFCSNAEGLHTRQNGADTWILDAVDYGRGQRQNSVGLSGEALEGSHEPLNRPSPARRRATTAPPPPPRTRL